MQEQHILATSIQNTGVGYSYYSPKEQYLRNINAIACGTHRNYIS